jgi:hypothetical protein
MAVAAVALAGVVVATGPLARAQSMGSDMAAVRVMHASPDAPAVDVWVNGEPKLTGLSFGQFTGHTWLPAGTHQVAVAPAGAPASQAVINAPVTLEAGQAYTVMAIGRLAEIKPLILDDERAPTMGNEAKVRFVHASPDAPAVDIAVAGGPTVLSSVAFGEASGYEMVPPLTDATLEVRAGGQTVLPLPGATFAPGGVYTAVAIGLAGGEPALQAVWLWDASSR